MRLTSICTLLLFICCYSCKNSVDINGSGNVVSQKIETTELTGIRNHTTLDINLSQSETSSVIHHPEDNLMDIYYKGNPSITKSISGIGDLVDNN